MIDDPYMRLVAKGVAPGQKTERYRVENKQSGDVLGTIRWYRPWRQYIFEASLGCVFNAGCLQTIRTWLEEAKLAQRQRNRDESGDAVGV